MKTNFRIVAGLMMAATLAFASCTKEKNDNVNPGENAKVDISIATPDTKATGGDPTNVTMTISNFKAFVFDASGILVGSGWSEDGLALTAARNKAISTTTAAKTVYVIANAGNFEVRNASVPGTPTKAELEAYIADLGSTNDGSQRTLQWATGSTAQDLVFTQTGSAFTASTTISLKFIAARITVKIVNQMSNFDNAVTTATDLKITNLAVLNARGASKLYGTLATVTPFTNAYSFYSGISGTGFENFPDGTSAGESVNAPTTWLADVPAYTAGTPGSFADTYVYYVFENTAVDKVDFPTIVTLVGTFNGQTLYYPVHLAPYEVLSTADAATKFANGVTRGNSYDLTITMKVDGKNKPGGGDDPTDPIVPGQLDVTCTVTNWVPVGVAKVFE
jgi:hypothetical protein